GLHRSCCRCHPVRDAGDAAPENQKAKALETLKIAQKPQKAFPYTTKRLKVTKQNREENNYGQIHLYAD
ncbi:MAG: hypothetical protein ACLUIR_02325, partial [Faecalibacterium prausnitzii]